MPISLGRMLAPAASLVVGRKGRKRKGSATPSGSLGELAKVVTGRRGRRKRATKGKTGKVSKPKTTRTRRRRRGTALQTRALAEGLLKGLGGLI
ncbi:MAG: hypothetical protein QXS01_04285 [Candidatus Bathyarchaeia archaeon]